MAELIGATKGAQAAIDRACYEQEMRELGAGRFFALSDDERTELAARAAHRFAVDAADSGDIGRLRKAAKWAMVAADRMSGFHHAAHMLGAAVALGLDGGRGREVLRRAICALVSAMAEDDVSPDSGRYSDWSP